MTFQKKDKIEFTERLIKGKVAEIVFQQMFIEMGTAIVIPYGYENATPVLAQYYKGMDEADKKELRTVSNMPDYILVAAETKKNAILVDVKYRRSFTRRVAKKVANELFNRWPTCWLFLATQDGFYFGKCEKVKENGEISPLHTRWVNKEKQEEYLNLLRRYISQ